MMQTTRPEGILAGVLTLGTAIGINYLTKGEYPKGILAGVLTLGTAIGINYLTKGEYKLVILAALTTIATFTKFITCYIFRRPESIRKFGKWAIITGSTDGIGKAIAIDYAKKG